MKTEAEIRSHRDDLKLALESPCKCGGTEHEYKCIIGQKMMVAVIGTLSWILGEKEDFQEAVDHYHQFAQKAKRKVH